MMSKQTINDALETTIGVYYQCYVALLDCFEMDEEEILNVETKGDISVISSTGKSFQKEVKHHKSMTYLNDKNIDFWKTFYNWVFEYKKMDEYNRLIFFTTANISSDSIFYDWNKKSLDDRMKSLTSLDFCIEDFDESKKNFTYYFKKIFTDQQEDDIKKIVVKIEIDYLNNKISTIKNDFAKYLKFIKDDNKMYHMIYDLIGHLIGKIQEDSGNTYKWCISSKEFREIVSEKTSFYTPNNSSIPTKFKYMEMPKEDFDKYTEYAFVTKIKDIDLNKEVNDSTICFWKTQQTIITYFNDDISLTEPLNAYKDNIENILFSKKKSNEVEKFADEIDRINRSKRFFYDMIGMQIMKVGSMSNHAFFQKGIIHTIANETEFKWKLGENDEI